jgi:hypothetical protein
VAASFLSESAFELTRFLYHGASLVAPKPRRIRRRSVSSFSKEPPPNDLSAASQLQTVIWVQSDIKRWASFRHTGPSQNEIKSARLRQPPSLKRSGSSFLGTGARSHMQHCIEAKRLFDLVMTCQELNFLSQVLWYQTEPCPPSEGAASAPAAS